MSVEELKVLAQELVKLKDDILWLNYSPKAADREDFMWNRADEIRGKASEAFGEKSPELIPIADQIKGDYREIVEMLAARQPRWQVVHARYAIKINNSIVRLTWVLGGLAVVQVILMSIQMCISE